MNDLTLFMVYHMGVVPFWNILVARPPEEALTQCFDQPGRAIPMSGKEKNCRAVEIKIKGYKIHIEKE